jgi:hypothetical protein
MTHKHIDTWIFNMETLLREKPLGPVTQIFTLLKWARWRANPVKGYKHTIRCDLVRGFKILVCHLISGISMLPSLIKHSLGLSIGIWHLMLSSWSNFLILHWMYLNIERIFKSSSVKRLSESMVKLKQYDLFTYTTYTCRFSDLL